MLLTAALIVHLASGSLELLRTWPVTTAESLSLAYSRPEDSCYNLMDMYFGRRSVSPMSNLFKTLDFGDDMMRNKH